MTSAVGIIYRFFALIRGLVVTALIGMSVLLVLKMYRTWDASQIMKESLTSNAPRTLKKPKLSRIESKAQEILNDVQFETRKIAHKTVDFLAIATK